MKRRYIVKSIKNVTYTDCDLLMSSIDPFTTYSHVNYYTVNALLNILCDNETKFDVNVKLIKLYNKCKMKIEIFGTEDNLDKLYKAIGRSELMQHFTMREVLV